jgi:hypothetical protein
VVCGLLVCFVGAIAELGYRLITVVAEDSEARWVSISLKPPNEIGTGTHPDRLPVMTAFPVFVVDGQKLDAGLTAAFATGRVATIVDQSFKAFFPIGVLLAFPAPLLQTVAVANMAGEIA